MMFSTFFPYFINNKPNTLHTVNIKKLNEYYKPIFFGFRIILEVMCWMLYLNLSFKLKISSSEYLLTTVGKYYM